MLHTSFQECSLKLVCLGEDPLRSDDRVEAAPRRYKWWEKPPAPSPGSRTLRKLKVHAGFTSKTIPDNFSDLERKGHVVTIFGHLKYLGDTSG